MRCSVKLGTRESLRAKSDCVRRFVIREIELESRANRIRYEDLIARVLDVLFLKIDPVSHKPPAHFGRACTLERDVIDATTVVPVFLDGACGEVCVDMY